jgi:hypothetical protein
LYILFLFLLFGSINNPLYLIPEFLVKDILLSYCPGPGEYLSKNSFFRELENLSSFLLKNISDFDLFNLDSFIVLILEFDKILEGLKFGLFGDEILDKDKYFCFFFCDYFVYSIKEKFIIFFICIKNINFISVWNRR